MTETLTLMRATHWRESEVSSATQLLLPQLLQMKNLALGLSDMAKSYQQAGDGDSANTILQMADALGQRYTTEMPAQFEISQLVGFAVERIALNGMDPSSPYGQDGETVQDRINQLTQEQATFTDLNQQADPIMDTLSDEDYLIYRDRWMAFGEQAALQWLISTYGQQ